MQATPALQVTQGSHQKQGAWTRDSRRNARQLMGVGAMGRAARQKMERKETEWGKRI
jgi:ribosomal protein L44E